MKMKKEYFFKGIITFVFFVFLLLGCLYYLQHQTIDVVKVGIIYPKRIKSEALFYKNFEQKFEQERQKLHDDFFQEEKEMRQQFDALKNNKRKTKKIEQAKKELEEKARHLEEKLIQKKDDFLFAIQKRTTELQNHLNVSIEKVAKEKSVNLVLNAETDEKILVLYSDKTLDITERVIEYLDRHFEKAKKNQ